VTKLPEFQRKQYEFAAHIRDPKKNATPTGIEDRRMAIYRELFFNNLQSILSKSFPVLKKLIGKKQWCNLIRKFMSQHESQTPYFLEIPKEFLVFLEHGHTSQSVDCPFLLELAHYEWAVLMLSVSTESDDMTEIDPNGDLLDGVPVISVLTMPLKYHFPVHRLSETFQPQAPSEQPTYLVVYRQPDNELNFMELNAVTTDLLKRIADNPKQQSGRELLIDLAKKIDFDSDALVQYGYEALREMKTSKIIIGTIKTNISFDI
jgi:hypothetical protein